MSNDPKTSGPKDFDIRQFREKPWLGAHSLGDKGKVVVEIDRVEGAMVQNKKGKSSKSIMYFKGIKKGMVLNETAFETLGDLFGSGDGKLMMSQLRGQKIGLFATTCMGAKGKMVSCLRIHDKRVDGKATLTEEMAKQMDHAVEDPASQDEKDQAFGLPKDLETFDTPVSEVKS